ncbi:MULTISPECIES: thiamine phosphate synthase [Staphylococcus]|uniref:Thiamine phosphate synthase n=1 Tax=Staphylococcus hsinchuensis TaxID=3051183 RepID=A0ABZ3EDV9_9STAP|nr:MULTISPECIES: thiamine phosphate synthase [unclassified Staphylococcus]
MFIAITPYKVLNEHDIEHYRRIEQDIDFLMIRTPMEVELLVEWIEQLKLNYFPINKIIIHSDIDVLERCELWAIHFKEQDARIAQFKQDNPNVQVSASTHYETSVGEAQSLGLDFVLFSHIFETGSKPGQPPRTDQEISSVLKYDIPIIALGGINSKTLKHLPQGFSGIAGISIFDKAHEDELSALKEVWQDYV